MVPVPTIHESAAFEAATPISSTQFILNAGLGLTFILLAKFADILE